MRRGVKRGYTGIIIKETLDSGKRFVEISVSDPEKEQRLFHKVFSRMGEKISVLTDKSKGSLIFKRNG